MATYPGFQRIFFLIDNEAALKQKKAARKLLGALRLVNAASPRTISVHKKKISSGTQGNGHLDKTQFLPPYKPCNYNFYKQPFI